MLALAIAVVAPQFPINEPIYDPSEHASPNGAYMLRIGPTARDGEGPATYEMLRAGEGVWELELPYLLTEVAVLDSGYVVGYSEIRSLTHSLEQDFVVAVVDPAGEVLLEESTEPTYAGYIGIGPSPHARGLLVDARAGRFSIRVADPDINRGIERWWTYHISSAERLDDFEPEAHLSDPGEVRRFLEDARYLEGSGLALVHWWLNDYADYDTRGYSVQGAQFTLQSLDDGEPLWSWELPSDYTLEGDEEADDALEELVGDVGAILETPGPDSFALWHVGTGERVEFRVSVDETSESGWRVDEVSRGSFEPERDSPPPDPATPPELVLQRLEDVELEAGVDGATSIGHLVAWGCDDVEGFRAIRGDSDGQFAAVHIDANGLVLDSRELDLPDRTMGTSLSWTHAGGAEWFLVSQTHGGPGWDDEHGTLEIFRVDGMHGTFAALPEFEAPRALDTTLSVKELAPDEHGGLVVLGAFHFEFTIANYVVAFDRLGRIRWAVGEHQPEGESLRSPRSVTVTSDGHVVVLSNSRGTLQRFDQEGAFLESIDLRERWGRGLQYPSTIRPAPDGGVLLFDFNGSPTLLHADREGSLVVGLTPTLADGRTPSRLPVEARFGPDGELWTFDGYGFLRLDEEGLVVERAGSEAQEGSIYSIYSTGVVDGRTYGRDERTGVLHAWNEEGERLFVGEALPADADLDCWKGQIAVDLDGTIWAALRSASRIGWTQSGARLGERGGALPLAVDAERGLTARLEESTVVIEDRGGSLVTRIERQPDERWLRGVSDAAFLGDGSIVLSHYEYDPLGDRVSSLLFYETDGQPIRQHVGFPGGPPLLPAGRWLIRYSGANEVLLLDLESGAEFRAPLCERSPGSMRTLGLSEDGKRLLIFENGPLLLRRYELP